LLQELVYFYYIFASQLSSFLQFFYWNYLIIR